MSIEMSVDPGSWSYEPPGSARFATRCRGFRLAGQILCGPVRGLGEPRDDLVQAALVGLVKAVDRFDPGRGVVFSTFVVPTIMGELRRHFRDKTWPVHVPRRGKDLYTAVGAVVDELDRGAGPVAVGR